VLATLVLKARSFCRNIALLNLYKKSKEGLYKGSKGSKSGINRAYIKKHIKKP
jgi:hypothetical protein